MENKIIDAYYGISKEGDIVCSVQIQEDLFLTLVEVKGNPNFYVTGEACFLSFTKKDGKYDSHSISSFNGINLKDYDELMENIDEEKSIFKYYILYLVRLVSMNEKDISFFIDSTKGKEIVDVF